MSIPITINFDFPSPGDHHENIVRLPKIYQGSPYDQTIRIRNEDDTYRDFATYDDIRIQFVSRHSTTPLLTLSKIGGTINTSDESLRFIFPGALTSNIKVPIVNHNAINEMRLLHTIILYEGGLEVERFAQGYALLVESVTEAA